VVQGVPCDKAQADEQGDRKCKTRKCRQARALVVGKRSDEWRCEANENQSRCGGIPMKDVAHKEGQDGIAGKPEGC